MYLMIRNYIKKNDRKKPKTFSLIVLNMLLKTLYLVLFSLKLNLIKSLCLAIFETSVQDLLKIESLDKVHDCVLAVTFTGLSSCYDYTRLLDVYLIKVFFFYAVLN